jgi:membrane protease YdiL (CAAX protease family)
VRRVARAAPLACFFGVTFLFTWALLPWARVSILVSLLALCGPAVGALVVAVAMGRSEARELSDRVTDWRLPAHWYVFALFLPVPISALRTALERFAGADGAIVVQPITVLGLIVFVLVAGEEIGWRGFALPRLLPSFGPWVASALLGVVWAFWHLPLFYMRGMPQFGSPFLAFIPYTIALSVILTAFAQHTRGSVVIATAFHGAVNTFGIVNTAASPTMRAWTNALSYGLVAALIVWGSSRGRR